jgi:hypothetical protein
MTTPTLQQQAGQQPPPPPQQAGQTVAQVATVLAGATTVAAALAMLMQLVYFQRMREMEVRSVLGIVLGHPPEATGISGPATERIWRLNLIRRAQYVVAASLRLHNDVTGAVSRGENPVTALLDGVERERRYYAQHLLAGWNRMNAAAGVDTMVMQVGLLLGWNTVIDRRTSPECLAANGHNFRADHMPKIGYPGAVHPHCRCYAGPPRPGANLLPALRWAA